MPFNESGPRRQRVASSTIVQLPSLCRGATRLLPRPLLFQIDEVLGIPPMITPGGAGPTTLNLLFTSQRLRSGTETGVGLGWRIGTDDHRRRIFHHGGTIEGGRAMLTIFPDSKVVVAPLAPSWRSLLCARTAAHRIACLCRPLPGWAAAGFLSQGFDLPELLRTTAWRTSVLNADSSTSSPSWMSIARRTCPSRLELKRRAGSLRDAPLAKVSFTTSL
jgi:Beta-lactamase